MTVPITSEYITLAQLLKAENIIESGGQAKHYLASYPVTLNDVAENRRGKKLYPGDTVVVQGESYQIELDQNPAKRVRERQEQAAILKKYRQAAKSKPAKDQPKGPGSWS